METKVEFLKDVDSNEIFAYFPNNNYNERLYGSSQKESYSHVGQHSACSVEYSLECAKASKAEYNDLLNQLEQIGYSELIVINQEKESKTRLNTFDEKLTKLMETSSDFDTFTEGFNNLEKEFKNNSK